LEERLCAKIYSLYNVILNQPELLPAANMKCANIPVSAEFQVDGTVHRLLS